MAGGISGDALIGYADAASDENFASRAESFKKQVDSQNKNSKRNAELAAAQGIASSAFK